MVYDPYQLRTVHDEAANRLHVWYNSFMKQEQEIAKNSKPDIAKVGPHGYIHGWIKVGAGIDSSDLTRDTHNIGGGKKVSVPKGTSHHSFKEPDWDSGDESSANKASDWLQQKHGVSQEEADSAISSAMEDQHDVHTTTSNGKKVSVVLGSGKIHHIFVAPEKKATTSRVIGDPSKGNGIKLTAKLKQSMISGLSDEMGPDDESVAKIKSLPTGAMVHPTLSEDERDNLIESQGEGALPAADSLHLSHDYLYG